MSLSTCFKGGLLALFLCFGHQASACEAPKNPPYPPLNVDGGMVVFGMKAVLEQQGVPNPEMGLSVSFLDCSTGVSKFVERLPYIADAGQIQDAFLARTSKDEQEVFLIHSVPFRASGGVSLGSDYFTVLVYRRTDDGFVQDKKLTEYFGSGADIISIRDDDEKTLYSYPFKTQEDIKRQLSSDNYHSWFTGMPIERVVNSKASIYSMQSTSGDTGMYLVKGDRVKQERYSAGWVYILYVTAKKKEIRGWVLCERINGC